MEKIQEFCFFFKREWLGMSVERERESYDATILFDSFTHIYLVFCQCFIHKMP